MTAVRAAWTSASFLVYLGALNALLGTVWVLTVLGEDSGDAGFVGWAAVALLAFSALAFGFQRARRPVVAGLFAFCAVVTFGIFVGALENWLGWLSEPEGNLFAGFKWDFLLLALLTAAAAAVALRIFRFPLLVAILAFTLWFFVTELVSGGGDWSAAVTMILGLILLALAIVVDGGPERPYGFWLHVAAAAAIGGGLLYFGHEDDVDWLVIALAGLIFIAVADRLARSSWAVLGAWGILQATTHFAEKWGGSEEFFPFYLLFPIFPFGFGEAFAPGEPSHPWTGPLLYVGVGLAFVTIGLLLAYRRRWRPPERTAEAL